MMLELVGLHVAYDSLGVVRGIDLSVGEGEIVTVLGSNGAGKTTTLRAVAGLHRPSRGRIVFAGRDITGLPAHEVAAAGLVLVPEGRQLFPEHTVLENLELGAYARLSSGKRREFRNDLEEVFELFPRVRERATQPAGLLSGGEQQMVAIARALVGRPRLLLLDEPSLGLAPLDLLRKSFPQPLHAAAWKGDSPTTGRYDSSDSFVAKEPRRAVPVLGRPAASQSQLPPPDRRQRRQL